MVQRTKVFVGNIVHCNKPFTVQTLEKGFVVVNEKGKIIAVDNLSALDSCKDKLGSFEEILLNDNQLLMPGFVDTHFHAPQYPNAGLGYDKPLLDWLQTYTYPLEKKYSDTEFAKTVYDAVVKRTLAAGSTTVSYFATLHLDSSLLLAEAAIKFGQRAFIGKVNMTELAPPDYVESPEDTISNTLEFIHKLVAKKCHLVQPIVTPRFALSLDLNDLNKLGQIANKFDLNIQSHISENKAEVEMVRDKFDDLLYAEVYDKTSLLTNKTVLAHAIYLTDSEIELLAERSTSVSHCPDSNTCLKSGLCDVKKLLKAGVNVGLGTDISGGYSTSIMNAMRSAVAVSTHVSFEREDYDPLNVYDVFYLATMGGAKALALNHKIGNFEIGKEFDAIVGEVQECFHPHTALELLQKFIYTGDDRNVLQVYVCGKRVK
ncbi:guanine deaminase [Agrilus planipennis]|uniref:Guanine deaminase n=1 Tax=Agrilus planipennis TaxID=224129 RepID=A0A1W4W3D1_AGRPL|nr:guanine deaminase [Agrilus planipennis]XP_018318672.1 guanine deaminase [Agrilus planipennis]